VNALRPARYRVWHLTRWHGPPNRVVSDGDPRWIAINSARSQARGSFDYAERRASRLLDDSPAISGLDPGHQCLFYISKRDAGRGPTRTRICVENWT